MKPERTYQHDFSESSPAMHDVDGRKRKAATMVAVLNDYFDISLHDLRVLDVGGSTGIIDEYLSNYFGSVTGIDIDEKAVNFASRTLNRENLYFHLGDAMNLAVSNEMIDVVICSQIYEHVPDAKKMIDEIYRVLRPGGICYFAASNRLMWNEPHYNLPLLSVVPRPIAHWYIRLAGKADFYHELHFSYWGLKNLVKAFKTIDYTRKVVEQPDRFGTAYMVSPGTIKAWLARLITEWVYWATPGYIWLLQKPGVFAAQKCVTGDVWNAVS
ncbi:MAG: class I SAM-dependent methyltransferase [Gammaproteobacteria bacterium]|nr:class I SAM-dependent methyltransferase [Gammaproteobacteria bacterium]MCP5458531.1 class I SAM-dependent methyltransferase [Gammaproteobacteria bacterium]